MPAPYTASPSSLKLLRVYRFRVFMMLIERTRHFSLGLGVNGGVPTGRISSRGGR